MFVRCELCGKYGDSHDAEHEMVKVSPVKEECWCHTCIDKNRGGDDEE